MTTATETFEHAGITYLRHGAVEYHIQAQGPGYLSRLRVTSDRSEVGAIVAELADRYATYVSVKDGGTISQDGSCRRLVLSSYFRATPSHDWQHGKGRKVTAMG